MKKFSIIIFFVLLIILIIENVFLVYKNSYKKKYYAKPLEYEVYYQGTNNNYERYLGDSFPTDGYKLNKSNSSCENNGTVSQDSNKKIKFSGGSDRCVLYFDRDHTTAVEDIRTFAGDADDTITDVIANTSLAYDGTSDKNLRYIGSDPNNYIDIGDTSSLWRIIGVMNNIDDGNGNIETRLKIIRADVLGSYSWDSSASSVNTGGGINEWSQADLMTELNGDYLNTSLASNTYWYNGSNNTQTAEFIYTNALSSNAQRLIDDAYWNLGTSGSNNYYSSYNGLASHFYAYERSNDSQKSTYPNCSVKYCNDTVNRSTSWIGKIALMYPSDYGYATSGSATKNRASCLNSILYNWSNYSDCITNSWIYTTGNYQWTLTPRPLNNGGYEVFIISDTGNLIDRHSGTVAPIYPVAYLKSDVIIQSGTGASTDPYIMVLP